MKNRLKKLLKVLLISLKKIDILINSIGEFSKEDILSLSEKKILNSFHRNFVISSILTKCFLSSMIKKQSGKIINIGSMAGQNGGIFAGDLYSASKAALINFTKSIAKKYGRYNIYCNCINPGPLESKMTKIWPKKIKEKLISNFKIRNGNNLGDTKDIAYIILFLASENSKLIQGTQINANGGLVI